MSSARVLDVSAPPAGLDAAALDVARGLADADEDLINKIAVVYAQKFTEDELRAGVDITLGR